MTIVLVVVAHPDDEVLGCGGTIARHAARGDDVHVICFADGTSSRGGSGARGDVINARYSEAEKAAKVLGVRPPLFFGFPDQRLDSVDILELTQKLELVMRDMRPSVVYTHHGGDLNSDHRLVHQAVLTALRPLPGSWTNKIYAFETMSSTEWSTRAMGEGFRPSRFVDIAGYLDLKMAAMAHYASEMRPFPHPRSFEAIKALAMLRGSSVGLRAAEAFEVIREIDG